MAHRKSRLALIAAAALLGYAGLRGKLRRYEIAETSMEPALHPGDYVVAQTRSGNMSRGDIVIFPHPMRPDLELIKRVVGLPGEDINVSNGQVHINGAVIAEPWADGPTRPDGQWQLGSDQVFVLGDNRSLSATDSRQIGPVDQAVVGWKVTARYWPVSGVGRIATEA